MDNSLRHALDARRALLVVDMQRDYCVPEGIIGMLGHDTSHFPQVGERLAAFVARARGSFDQLVFIRTDFPAWPRSRAQRLHYGRNALARQRDPSLTDWFGVRPQPGDPVISKARYSAFRDTQLDALLRASRIETVVVCGATTDVCVDTTARDAFMHDYSVVVLSDCCGASTPERHRHALDVLDHFFARVQTSGEVAEALEQLGPPPAG
ncbi:cysteine hydrolase family protein [Ramlibacter rhizophilus]|uniref:Cysteine hydrolase n=1 Tax=Ramlibacter rhizophilus TaxID=1781167 RepID=A0A4Z0BIK8_9BURK|nr:isochorismatase family cysteine hydrolase [Ramlibacter rhizophilus]TFY98610.1 cysteine hydrolase [Ramlibacter rhizophilus]